MERFKYFMKIGSLKMKPTELDAKMVEYCDRLYLEGECPSKGERLWTGLRLLLPVVANQGQL